MELALSRTAPGGRDLLGTIALIPVVMNVPMDNSATVTPPDSANYMKPANLENTSHATGIPPMIVSVQAAQMGKLQTRRIHRRVICALLGTAGRWVEVANNVPNPSTTM